MTKCPECGFTSESNRNRCLICDKPIGPAEDITSPPVIDRPDAPSNRCPPLLVPPPTKRNGSLRQNLAIVSYAVFLFGFVSIFVAFDQPIGYRTGITAFLSDFGGPDLSEHQMYLAFAGLLLAVGLVLQIIAFFKNE